MRGSYDVEDLFLLNPIQMRVRSQKDGVVFQGTDSREFWERAEERNAGTSDLYDKLGLPKYAAMEAFVRWKY